MLDDGGFYIEKTEFLNETLNAMVLVFKLKNTSLKNVNLSLYVMKGSRYWLVGMVHIHDK